MCLADEGTDKENGKVRKWESVQVGKQANDEARNQNDESMPNDQMSKCPNKRIFRH